MDRVNVSFDHYGHSAEPKTNISDRAAAANEALRLFADWCGMRSSALVITALFLAGCAGPTWPDGQFPAEVEVERTLFAAGGGGFRETCEAIVVELTDEAATRIVRARSGNNGLELLPPAGWSNTPIEENASDRALYKGAFGGCSDDGGRPLGDLPGALTRPGAFYRVVNGGEGIAIIIPRAKLAGFFYFG